MIAAGRENNRRTVLVTGGAGYVGSHACKALAAAGWLPVTYDDFSTGHRDLVKWGPVEEGDITDAARLDAAIARHRPQAVMHFAAFSVIGASLADPASTYGVNVGGTLTLLDAMRRHTIGTMVFSSSCSTYGTPDRLPITEGAPQRPINPYGWSKLMGERMLADFSAGHGLRAASLRYFNAAGADSAGETGEDHRPETHLIPRALMAAAGAIPALEVFGTDHPTADGTCIRDYVHVSDLARWHVAALERLMAGGDRLLDLNLGSGCGASVRQVVAAVERITARAVPLRMMPARPGDPPALVADTTLLRRLLPEPPPRDLDAMVETAWRWMQARG